MTAITAAMVKELRDSTGAGMMDAKKALTENDGNMEAAVDWLRTKGLAKAAKKADRVAAEGLVGVAVSNGRGVAVEINSETDFVAKNADFQALVRDVANVALTTGESVEVVKAAALNGKTVEEVIQESIARIGENMTGRRNGCVLCPQLGRRRHGQDRRSRGAEGRRGQGAGNRQAVRDAHRRDQPAVAVGSDP
jgi:elongation factor Ts